MTRHCLLILLLSVGLTSGTGCQVLGIPSYRNDCGSDLSCSYGSNDANCEPGVLPPAVPLPGCLAKWKKRQAIPQPPAYPRFHPLPTRPMFSNRESSASGHLSEVNTAVPYGSWPAAIDGGPASDSRTRRDRDGVPYELQDGEGVLVPPQM